MRRLLVLVGVLVAAYVYVLVNSVLVYNSNNPEVIINYWLSPAAIQIIMYAFILVLVGHFWLVRMAVKKEVMIWSTAVPFFVSPYMVGVIVQAVAL